MDAQDLLLRALNAAISEPELVSDIAESCRHSDIDVFTVASWTDEKEAADKLFLTPEEARKLLNAAKRVISSK